MLHHDKRHLTLPISPRNFFYQKQHDSRPHRSYFTLFPRSKIKLKGLHSDTTEVIETESQAALNTLTEHDNQDELKKKQGRGARNGEYAWNGITSRAMVASRRKANF
jgi:hypothetical protein